MKPRLSLSSVRVRLALWNVGVLALVLVGLGIIFSVTMRANINAAINQRLSVRAHRAEQFFLNAPPPPPLSYRRSPPPPRDSTPDPSGELRPSLFDGRGRPFRPDDTPLDPAGLSRAEAGEEVYTPVRIAGVPVRVFSLPIRQGGRVVGVAQTGNSLTRIHAEIAEMTRTLVYLIPVVLLIAGLGGAFLTDRALRPVRRIAAAANQIEAEDLSQRLPVMGDDEFADLAVTINGMLSRLQIGFERQEQAFEQQRRFAADASHELRTPLTIIKANTSLSLSERRTETEYEKTLRAVDTAADRMTRIVQDLLLLARADAGQLAYSLVPTPLPDVLELAAASLPSLDHAPVELDLPAQPILVLAHADSLVRLFSNLLENAARHTPGDGHIVVSVERLGRQVSVEVSDTGTGIAPEHLPHVTERFYRIEAARSRAHGGTGLGLSICRSIADLHGGSLEITSTLGQGTTVCVLLQVAEPEDLVAASGTVLAAKA